MLCSKRCDFRCKSVKIYNVSFVIYCHRIKIANEKKTDQYGDLFDK